MAGKSVRIFLADGSASGVRYAEIVNWTGQAIAAPITRLGALAEWSNELGKAGVYLLIGENEQGDALVYVGESENVLKRISQHLKGGEKPFVEHIVAITSKDQNLTKSHIRYVEAKLIRLAREAGRVKLDNGAGRDEPTPLPRADAATMDEFTDLVQSLVDALGYRYFERFVQRVREIGASNVEAAVANVDATSIGAGLDVFTFEGSGFKARMTRTNDGYVLLEGSRVSASLADSLAAKTRLRRVQEAANGTLVTVDGETRTTRDIAFGSSSAAAAFVAGSERSGPQSWQLNGRLLKDVERASAEVLSRVAESADSEGGAASTANHAALAVDAVVPTRTVESRRQEMGSGEQSPSLTGRELVASNGKE